MWLQFIHYNLPIFLKKRKERDVVMGNTRKWAAEYATSSCMRSSKWREQLMRDSCFFFLGWWLIVVWVDKWAINPITLRIWVRISGNALTNRISNLIYVRYTPTILIQISQLRTNYRITGLYLKKYKHTIPSFSLFPSLSFVSCPFPILQINMPFNNIIIQIKQCFFSKIERCRPIKNTTSWIMKINKQGMTIRVSLPRPVP